MRFSFGWLSDHLEPYGTLGVLAKAPLDFTVMMKKGFGHDTTSS